MIQDCSYISPFLFGQRSSAVHDIIRGWKGSATQVKEKNLLKPLWPPNKDTNKKDKRPTLGSL